MRPTLDTNLLLRLVLRDIPGQYEAVRDLLIASGARYRVTDMAIVEVVHALAHHYGLSRQQIVEIIRAIILDPAIEASTNLLEAVTEQFLLQPALSFTDCYLAEEALVSGNLPLLTFDKKLAKQHDSAQLLPLHHHA